MKNPPICLEDEHEENGICVKNPPICLEDEHEENGICVKNPPICLEDEHEENGICVKNPKKYTCHPSCFCNDNSRICIKCVDDNSFMV